MLKIASERLMNFHISDCFSYESFLISICIDLNFLLSNSHDPFSKRKPVFKSLYKPNANTNTLNHNIVSEYTTFCLTHHQPGWVY